MKKFFFAFTMTCLFSIVGHSKWTLNTRTAFGYDSVLGSSFSVSPRLSYEVMPNIGLGAIIRVLGAGRANGGFVMGPSLDYNYDFGGVVFDSNLALLSQGSNAFAVVGVGSYFKMNEKWGLGFGIESRFRISGADPLERYSPGYINIVYSF